MNYFRYVTIALIMGIPLSGAAQLPGNPWANKSPVADKQIPTKAVMSDAKNTPNTLETELPDFVGSNSTWNTAMGQKMIAPDVNITNMLLMTQHLRNMGYQIPDGIDNLINTAPEKLRRQIMASMIYLKQSNHPVATASNAYAEIFEKYTGLSIENLIENSLRIIDSRR